MATEKPTPTRIEERLTAKELSDFRSIRRAAMGIKACAEIYAKHDVNVDLTPVFPSVFIQLEPNQALGVMYAIDTCAGRINEILDRVEYQDIGFTDDICPEVTIEAKALADLQAGTIDFKQYEKRVRNAS